MAGQRCKKKRERDYPPWREVRALYVHVPFCRRKCRYCDFFSRPVDRELVEAYLRAAIAELDARRGVLAGPLDSVFVGGGTPSVLGRRALGDLLEPLSALTDARTEFSVEVNPESTSATLARTLAHAGVNRVTVGVQSLEPELLTFLARAHGPDDAIGAIRAVRQAGIENVGADLMYGIPGQSAASWGRTLSALIGLGVQHLSCYALSFEPGTPLHSAWQRGEVTAMDEALERALYEQAIDLAEQAGMQHYEISNVAMPGRLCRHNTTYWRNLPYLGIGPAATSYVDGVRRTTRRDLEAYLSGRGGWDAPERFETRERLTGRAAMAETVMLALRMMQGLDRKAFVSRFGTDVLDVFPRTIRRYLRQGALVLSSTHLRLARSAFFVSDTILADILAEA